MDTTTSGSTVALKIELERIEALLQRALVLATSSAGASFAGPIVANEAAASALGGLVEGEQIYILSHRSIWVKRVVDAPPLLAHQVIASAGGGVLERTDYSDPAWRIQITDIYIDSNANAENQGIYNGVPGVPAPIPGAEFARRWQQQRTVRAAGDVATAPNYITIHVVADMTATDVLALNACIDSANGTAIRVIGEGAPVLLAGNLDAVGGFTAENPAAAGGGTKALIKSGAQVWAAFVGKRIRFTATGIVAGIMTDDGGGVASINAPSLSGFQNIYGLPVLANPANGAAFVIEQLRHVNMSQPVITVQATTGVPPNFGGTSVQLVDVDVTGDFAWMAFINPDSSFQPYQCTFTQTANFSFGISLAASNIYSSCVFKDVFFQNLVNSSGLLDACGAVYSFSPTDGATFSCDGSEGGLFFGLLVNSTLFQGGKVLFQGVCAAHDFAVFGAANAAAAGVMIGAHTTFTMRGGSTLTLRTRMWGNTGIGGVGFGLQFQPHCALNVGATVPNITGPSGDIAPVSVAIPAAAQQRWWWFDDDPASLTVGTYQPAAGISPITWANYSAGRGPAGFGLYAHMPSADCHITDWNTH